MSDRTGWFHHYDYPEIVRIADSNGIAHGRIGPVPAGYIWYLERYTTWSSNGSPTSPVVEVYVQNANGINPGITSSTAGMRSGRVDVTTSANAAQASALPVVAPEMMFVEVLWLGFTPGDTVQMTFQVCVHQLVPVPFESVQDRAANMLAHDTAKEHQALSHQVTGDLVV